MVSMNRLTTEKRSQVVAALVEGNSIRATVRMTGVAKNTVTKLLTDLGTVCSVYQDQAMRDLPCERIQCDEIWAFVGAKAKNVKPNKRAEGWGDVWTWVGMDADSKLVASYRVGSRSPEDAAEFMRDLAKRLRNRVQLTTDGHQPYIVAVDWAFEGEIDFATPYGVDAAERQRRYAPAKCVGVEGPVISGNPYPEHVLD